MATLPRSGPRDLTTSDMRHHDSSTETGFCRKREHMMRRVIAGLVLTVMGAQARSEGIIGSRRSRKQCLVLLVALVTILTSCGGVSVSGDFDAGAAGTNTISGKVSIVHLTYISDAKGGSTTVTVVTLLQDWSAQELTFCGSQVSEFPMNAVVSANYTAGSMCSTLNSVKINR